jgi:hypothetical protein
VGNADFGQLFGEIRKEVAFKNTTDVKKKFGVGIGSFKEQV